MGQTFFIPPAKKVIISIIQSEFDILLARLINDRRLLCTVANEDIIGPANQ